MLYTKEMCVKLKACCDNDIKTRESEELNTLEYNKKLEIIHLENANYLEQLIDQYGYPDNEDLKNTIFTIVQHAISKPNFMIKIKNILQENKKHNLLLAYLDDRINFYQRKPQKYGTQYDYNIEGVMSIWTLLDTIEETNKRRISLGLSTVEENNKNFITIPKIENYNELIEGMNRQNDWLIKTGWATKETIIEYMKKIKK